MGSTRSFPFTCGLSLRICLRCCACLGSIMACLFIAMGSIIATRAVKQRGYQQDVQGDFYIYGSYRIYHPGNNQFLFCLSLTLIAINGLQILLDVLTFVESFQRMVFLRKIWLRCTLFFGNLILWSLTLICLVIILSGSGLLLLTFFLTGTSIRSYILTILYQYIVQMRKLIDSSLVIPVSPAASHHSIKLIT